MKQFLNKNLAFVIVFFWTTIAFAEPIPPPPPTPPPPGLPIDGAVFVLIFISLIYGLYKIHHFHKKQNASN